MKVNKKNKDKIRLLKEIRDAIKQTDNLGFENEQNVIKNLVKIIKEVQIQMYIEVSRDLNISVSKLVCNLEKFAKI